MIGNEQIDLRTRCIVSTFVGYKLKKKLDFESPTHKVAHLVLKDFIRGVKKQRKEFVVERKQIGEKLNEDKQMKKENW